MQTSFWRLLWVHLLGLLALVSLTSPVSAAPATPGSASDSPGVSAPSLVADQLVTLSRKTLFGTQAPRPDQLTRASILLEKAVDLIQNDPELWRLRLELARESDDLQSQRRALKAYLKLRPQDQRAALELINLDLRQLQTVQQRIDLLQKRLEIAERSQLAAPLVSRIASTLAQLARDAGDWSLFRQNLGRAITTDPTNRHATEMLYQLALDRGGSNAQLGQALIAYVRAAPFDPALRRSFADILLTERAFALAAEQYEVAAQQFAIIIDDMDFYFAWASALSGEGRLADAADLLAQLDAAMQAKPSSTAGQAPDQAPPSGTILPIELERLRFMLFEAMADATRADAAYERIRRALLGPSGNPGNPGNPTPPQTSDPQTQSTPTTMPAGQSDSLDMNRVILTWVRLMSDREIDQARQDVHAGLLSQVSPASGDQGLAWLKLRDQDLQAAREIFRVHAESDLFAAYGLAMTYPEDSEQRIELLQSVVAQGPVSLAGIAAILELQRADVVVQPTDTGKRLVDRAGQWHLQLRKPEPQINPWTMVKLEAPVTTYAYLDPVLANVTVRNVAPFALSVGGDEGTIPTTVLLQAIPRIGGDAVMQGAGQAIADLGRALTLEPGDAVHVGVRLDRSQLGQFLAHMPTRNVGLTVTGILDPRPTRTGRMTPGPLGSRGVLQFLRRPGMPLNESTVESWILAIDDPDRVEQIRNLARLTCAISTLANAQPTPDDQVDPTIVSPLELRRRMIDALVDAYDRVNPTAQAIVISLLPTTADARPLFETIRAQAIRSTDPLHQIIYLASQVTDLQDPALAAAQRSDDPQVQAFADAMAQAIEIANTASRNRPTQNTAGQAPFAIPSSIEK